MASPPLTSYLFFWNLKTLQDNAWHPFPGASSTTYLSNLPAWTQKLDLAATAVDAAPFVTASGTIAYLSQLNNLGWTVPASPFANKLTISTLHRSALIATPVILGLQALDVQYRYLIPRWASERERRRDEEQARNHVEVGMLGGGALMIARTLAGMGPRWSLLDVVLGGALADVLLREYYRAHDF
jgi:hypothetical protein